MSGTIVTRRWLLAAATLAVVAALVLSSMQVHAQSQYKGFTQGWCTYYAALAFDERATGGGIDWRGNAEAWLRNADAESWVTKTNAHDARVGAIVVWRGGPSGWGHVAIVRSVHSSGIWVQEMNYRGFDQVSSAFLAYSNLDRGSLRFSGYVWPEKERQPWWMWAWA